MDANLIQTLWVWWGTIPSDFRFLMLLPFAIGGSAVLVDALRQIWVVERRRLFSPHVTARRSWHAAGASMHAAPGGKHRPFVQPSAALSAGDGSPKAAPATRAR